MALAPAPWSPPQHRRYPPAFRGAARALLLAAHRAHASGAHTKVHLEGAPTPTLGSLPLPLLEGVVRLAAYPLSAWADP